jgi:outer membrane protein TolC
MWVLVSLLTAPASALTLEEALAAAEAHGPQMGIATAEVDVARGQQRQARAALLPKLAFGASGTWNDEEVALDLGDYLPEALVTAIGPLDPIVVQPKTYGQVSAALIVPIVDASGFATMTAARAQRDSAEAGVDDARLSAYVAVTTAYIGLRDARAAVALGDDAITLAEHQVTLAKAGQGSGIVSEWQVSEAALRLTQARRDRARAAAGVVEASGALARLTGIQVGDDPLAPPKLGPTAEGGVHPAIAAAKARLSAAKAARSAVNLDYVPDVTAQLTGVITGNKGFSDDNRFLVGTVTATFVPWDGGYRDGKGVEAAARVREAEIVVADTEARVAAARDTAAAKLETAEESLRTASGDVDVATEAHHRAEQAFAAGVAPFVDVERAALLLDSARFERQQAESDRDLAVVDVHLAQGSW